MHIHFTVNVAKRSALEKSEFNSLNVKPLSINSG